MKYTYSLQMLVRILVLCLFMQNCSSFAKLALDNIEEHNKQLDIQAVLDKEFTAEGGHLVSFYQYNKDIKASVEVNPLDEKDKIYDEVEVVIEKGVELSNLVKLDRKTQQKRIKIRFSEDQKGKPKSVIVHKPWLVGGHGDVIMFCGNPGVGKSTLCNSIFQQAIFSSGVSTRTGMTTVKQEYQHEGKLYIDTPGLADTDTSHPAAKEIEEALKKNGNYKIVFVITLKSGRLRPEDVNTINTVCEAIKVPFEYGLIINKISEGVIKEINQKGLDSYITSFSKRPYAAVVLRMDDEIEDMQNSYFQPESQNRDSLLNFLSNLRPNRIHESDVNPLDVADNKEKSQAQERENNRVQEEFTRMQEENRRIQEERRRIEQEKLRDQESIRFRIVFEGINRGRHPSSEGCIRGNETLCLIS